MTVKYKKKRLIFHLGTSTNIDAALDVRVDLLLTQHLTFPSPFLIPPILICMLLRRPLGENSVSNSVSSVVSSRAFGCRTVGIKNSLSKQILK